MQAYPIVCRFIRLAKKVFVFVSRLVSGYLGYRKSKSIMKGFVMVQVGQYGIKETLEVIDFGMAIISGMYQAKADGKIDMNDIGFIMPAGMAAPAAFEGITEVMNEIKDLKEEEVVVIKNHVLTKWKAIPGINENWLKLVSASFKIAEGALEGLEAVKGMKKPVAE